MKDIKMYGSYVVLTDVLEDEEMAEVIKENMLKLSEQKKESLKELGLIEVPKTTTFIVKRLTDFKTDPFNDETMQMPGVTSVAIKYLAYPAPAQTAAEPAAETEDESV